MIEGIGKISHGITGSRSLPEMVAELRPEARSECEAMGGNLDAIVNGARWAWTFEDAIGNFVASVAIMPDGYRRGWVIVFPGKRLTAANSRPLVRLFRQFTGSGAVYDELRAWVDAGDRRAIRFAKWAGFRLDCGPATGLGPTGRDMSLFLWRR